MIETYHPLHPFFRTDGVCSIGHTSGTCIQSHTV